MASEHISEITSPTSCQGNMNQICKVCGEPAAGFHFGAFTCEGCKSFFGRTYNNISSLNDCKNNGRCVINKKTRTSCKSCRLRKCIMVGMSKSGSRYGRRSNWFKIHYLMQSNNNNNNNDNDINNDNNNSGSNNSMNIPSSESPLGRLGSWDSLSESSLVASDDKYSLLSIRNRLGSPSNSVNSDISNVLNMNQETKEIQSSIKVASHIKINGEGSNTPERQGIISPSPSSSDSHSSDSSIKENGEVPLFPNYIADPLQTKDLLSLCSMPGLGQRLPPYLNPSTLASRFFYPYYPNLFSYYSRTPYFDNLFTRTKSSNEKTLFPKTEHKESGNKDFQPPLKIFKPNSASPLSLKVNSPWNSKQAKPYSPQSPPTATWCNIDSSNDDIKPSIRKEGKTEELSTVSQENLPIDLSIRSKELTQEVDTELKSNEEEPEDSLITEKYKVSFVIGEDVQKKETPVHEQQIPLDLSGFKT